MPGLLRRAVAYRPYCEAFHVIGALKEKELRQLHEAVPDHPLILSNSQLAPATLSACNVKLNLQGHAPFLSAMRAAEKAYSGEKNECLSQENLAFALKSDQWSLFQERYLKVKKAHPGLK